VNKCWQGYGCLIEEAEGSKSRLAEGLEDCAVAFQGTRAGGKQERGSWARRRPKGHGP